MGDHRTQSYLSWMTWDRGATEVGVYMHLPKAYLSGWAFLFAQIESLQGLIQYDMQWYTA